MILALSSKHSMPKTQLISTTFCIGSNVNPDSLVIYKAKDLCNFENPITYTNKFIKENSVEDKK
jgi:hypothetical protein